MRLALSILLIGIFLAIPGVMLSDVVFEREFRDQTAANRIGTAFTWPNSPAAGDPERTLRILMEASDATESNVIRTSIGMSDPERTHITHYVYLDREHTRLFNEFTLMEGRWLTQEESRSGSALVSSAWPEDTENVGNPSVFADGYDLTFAPLHHAFDSLPTTGRYVIDSPNEAATERFISIVHHQLVEAGAIDLTIEDLMVDDTHTIPRSDISPLIGSHILPYALVVLAALLVSAILLREGKLIGVMRLLGHPAIRIWYRAVGRIQIFSVLIGLTLCGALLLFLPGSDASFARTLATAVLGVTTVIFSTTLVAGMLVIKRVHVGELIKGGLQ